MTLHVHHIAVLTHSLSAVEESLPSELKRLGIDTFPAEGAQEQYIAGLPCAACSGSARPSCCASRPWRADLARAAGPPAPGAPLARRQPRRSIPLRTDGAERCRPLAGADGPPWPFTGHLWPAARRFDDRCGQV